MAKEIKFNSDARDALKRGVDSLSNSKGYSWPKRKKCCDR